MLTKLLFFIFLLIGHSSWALEQGPYTLQDLKILREERSFKEFIAHVLDPRPSERNEDWKKMVQEVSNAFSKELMAKEDLNLKDFKDIEKLWELPLLKEESIFKERRRDIGIKFLQSCFKKKNNCTKLFKNYADSTPEDDAETHFQLSKLLSSTKESPFPTWKYLEMALRSEASEFYCRHEFALNAIWEQLEIELLRSDLKGDISKKIQLIAHPNCLPSLIKFSFDKLKNPKKIQDRELAFHLLNSHSKIDQKHVDLFYTLYLLETPSKGETFNISWNRLLELRKSPERREKVLMEIKQLDPFPDQIMGSLDLTKKRAILLHLKAHFPELLDSYLNQCIDYYSGRKKFSNGNPTINCSQLMSSEISIKVFDSFQIENFKKIKTI